MELEQITYKEFKILVGNAVDNILWGYDGPVTRYVAISRAVQLTSKPHLFKVADSGEYSTMDVVTEALEEALDQIADENELPSNCYNTADGGF